MIPVGYRFYKGLIAEYASKVGLDPLLVAAVCWQESAFNTNAFRFEPDFWNRYLKPNAKYNQLNPQRVSSSYGLMQVMYCRVHEDKMLDNDALPPEHLFVPEMGLRTGTQFLAELLKWAQGKTSDPALAVRAALASYNGGRGGNDPSKDNPLRNGKYAGEVLHKLELLKKAGV